MDGLDYCRDRAAAEGSAGYYAVLFFDPGPRAGLIALHALERELRDAVEACSELTVAEHKLGFWREELGRLLDDAPRHPVTHALARHAPGAIDRDLAARLLEGARLRCRQAQVRTAQELEQDCARTAGTLAQAAARLLAPRDPGAARAAADAAAAAERARLLCLPRRAGLPPHTGVPQDLLAGAGARPADVDRGGGGAALARLRRTLLDGARESLLRTRRSLPQRRGYAATRVAIALAELAALERGGYVAHGRARAALPVALLWHAWRHRP